MIRFLLVVALTACSAPATWRPPENAETVLVDGDLIVRAEPDGTISVSTRVVLGDASASGFVRLRGGEIATAAKSQHVRLARARAWQALAATLVADPDRSFQAAKHGTEELATVVFIAGRGVKVAELLRMENRMPEAASRMASALHDYLRGYVRKFHAEVW